MPVTAFAIPDSEEYFNVCTKCGKGDIGAVKCPCTLTNAPGRTDTVEPGRSLTAQGTMSMDGLSETAEFDLIEEGSRNA